MHGPTWPGPRRPHYSLHAFLGLGFLSLKYRCHKRSFLKSPPLLMLSVKDSWVASKILHQPLESILLK